MRSLLWSIATLSLGLASVSAAKFPKKIYGVNLGSWLLIEPWMLPHEWVTMGGEINCDCSQCIGSEFALVQAYPDTADAKFRKHWDTWFTQSDVNHLKALGINTVRIPLGYWIVEDLVDRTKEFYPRGGLAELRRGLKQLADAGIVAVLDHHAPPGVQATNQQFAGRCTADLEFYTPYNYGRALVWTAVMTALSHVDSAFSNVVSIEAVNEIDMDANNTPGYGDFQKNFVATVRAVELLLGIPIPSSSVKFQASISANSTVSLGAYASLPSIFNQDVKDAIADAIPILLKLGVKGISDIFTFNKSNSKTPLTTMFMDINWQHNNPPNPADAAIGPQIYDNHLYYSFGGVADANETAYLTHNCNLDRIQSDAALGNSPLVFGEWGLSTNFDATDDFLKKWADSQKLNYGKDAGWIFWNFKIEKSTEAGDTARQWSYFEGVERGYLTKDPAAFNDPHVCDAYIKK